MWLNGGYYYRGMIYCGGEAIGPLVGHLGGPALPPKRARDPAWGTGSEPYYHETDMRPLFDYLEERPPKGKCPKRGYSGEDWPQPIGTWEAMYYPHMALDRDTGQVIIPDADDARRERDVCPCMGTGLQSPDCKLPSYRQPVRA